MKRRYTISLEEIFRILRDWGTSSQVINDAAASKTDLEVLYKKTTGHDLIYWWDVDTFEVIENHDHQNYGFQHRN